MAFEIEKVTIHQLVAKMGCGCKKIQEFENNHYDKSVGDGLYYGCVKHAGKEGGDIISTILTEFLETEAKREAAKPTTRQVQPGVEIDEHGNVTNKIEMPNKIKPLNRRPALSAVAHPPQMPDVVEPGESGDAMDALLASEDPFEQAVTITPSRTSK
jgi:hypothetical protein